MGGKFKVPFFFLYEGYRSLYVARSFGFIARWRNGVKGFKVLLGGGLDQSQDADELFFTTDRLFFNGKCSRVFDRLGKKVGKGLE